MNVLFALLIVDNYRTFLMRKKKHSFDSKVDRLTLFFRNYNFYFL